MLLEELYAKSLFMVYMSVKAPSTVAIQKFIFKIPTHLISLEIVILYWMSNALSVAPPGIKLVGVPRHNSRRRFRDRCGSALRHRAAVSTPLPSRLPSFKYYTVFNANAKPVARSMNTSLI